MKIARISSILCNFARRMSTEPPRLVEESFDSIKNFLSQFEGGKITLNKNNESGVAILQLDYPEKKNAISGTMMVDLRNSVEELEKWNEGKAVIVCGKGGNFCSGGDLDVARATGTPQKAMRLATWMQDTLRRLQRLPLVSLCLIEGPSLGGGAEVSVFCDFIIAADNVKYGFVHGKMGIITAWGGGTRLTRRIGQTKALDLLLTSRVIGAEECLRLGLAEAIVPAATALQGAEEWLATRIQHHYSVVRANKNVVHRSECDTCDGSYNFERNVFVPFWGGDLNRVALSRNLKHVKK